VAPGSTKWGRSFLKLNTSLLREKVLLELLENFWFIWQSCKDAYADLSQWWDAGKKRIKSIIIDFSRERAHARKLELPRLKSQIKQFKSRIASGDTVCERELNDANETVFFQL